jgi:hypothetical protein
VKESYIDKISIAPRSTAQSFVRTIARVKTRPSKLYPNLFYRTSFGTFVADNRVAIPTVPLKLHMNAFRVSAVARVNFNFKWVILRVFDKSQGKKASTVWDEEKLHG